MEKWVKICPEDDTDSMSDRMKTLTDKLKVPSGWIIRTRCSKYNNGGVAVHQIFIKDETHSWELSQTY